MNQDAIWDYFQNEGVASFDGSEARLSYLVKKIAPGLEYRCRFGRIRKAWDCTWDRHPLY